MSSPLSIFKKTYPWLLNILFPLHCVSCKKNGSSFCSLCRKKIPLHGNFDHTGIFSLWDYNNSRVRDAIQGLKYKNKKMIAFEIAESLHDALFEQLAEKSIFENPAIAFALYEYVIIPIPLSQKRFKKRGYNQSELLAKELTSKNILSFTLETNVLYKIKDTETQVSTKNRIKRFQNICGSFAVKNSEKIQGKTVLLIDDVVTTGATIGEARKMLLAAGAQTVYGVTIAH